MPRNADVAPERCPESLWLAASRIEGWLTRDEADLLWRYARSPWCEVGTFKGRSARVLAARGCGYCVDLFESWYRNEALYNLVEEPIIPVRGDAVAAADQVPDDLAFVYLDADHGFDATLAAFYAYAPKVRPGGHVALHDVLELHPDGIEWPGANSALHVLTREAYQLVAAAGRIAVFRL